MARPRLGWPVVRVALRAVSQGATHREAAKLAGISVGSVDNYAVEHGVGVLRPRVQRPGALRIDEREEIMLGIERAESDAQIGARLGRHRSTIYRDIRAGGGRRNYRPYRAQRRADDQSRRCRPSWIVTRPWLWDEVVALLKTPKWSPEQISSWLRREHPGEPEWWVSHESIYQAIFVQAKGELRKELAACLCSGRARRRPRARSTGTGSPIVGMVNISQRPAEVADRAVPGHWEGAI